jgi:hypothetical protein
MTNQERIDKMVEQYKELDGKINEGQSQLNEMAITRTKLVGGIETLNLLIQEEQEAKVEKKK